MNPQLPFTVRADLDLGRRIGPYLVDRDADVEIRRGNVPQQLEGDGADGASYQIRGGRMLLRVPNGLRYLIEEGRRILYAGDAGADDPDLALFLLGSAWGALCYQRGLIPLHASAVAVDGAVHAFTGPSGAGKSTLAAALAARGRALFTDDVLILDPARLDPEPLCFTGQKELKLWQDAIDLTGAERGQPVRSAEGFEKYFARPLNETAAVSGRLANLVILGEDKVREGPNIEPLSGGRAVTQLVASVYRPQFAQAIIGRRTLYEALARLVGRVRVHRFRRRFHADDFAGGVAFLDAWIEAHG
jgi:hypothetical protein